MRRKIIFILFAFAATLPNYVDADYNETSMKIGDLYYKIDRSNLVAEVAPNRVVDYTIAPFQDITGDVVIPTTVKVHHLVIC